jgi:hypothetical protein
VLPLIETIIGFSAIMLILSFLVKSLTSVIKNHFDFYSENLKHEVYSLLEGTIGMSRKQIRNMIRDNPELRAKFPLLANDWKRLGEKYLTKANIAWVLKELDPQKLTATVIQSLEGRLAVHVENVRYMFEKRLKNVTLAVGLAFCLGLNINAFSIWDKLYNDEDVRTKFSSTAFVNSAIESEEQLAEAVKELPEGKEKKELAEQRKAIKRQIAHFRGQVSFGISKIWTEPPKKGREAEFLLFEFFGSLLTGILVSIGAPYWHDLLRALGKLRQGKSETKP